MAVISKPTTQQNAGFSLVEVMIAIAIVAVLSLTSAIIFGNINRMAAQPEARASTESVGLLAKLILTNGNLCDNALRQAGNNGAGAHPSVGAFPLTIDHIQMYDPKNPSALDLPAITTNDPVGPHLKISLIQFVEASTVTRTTVKIAANLYNVYFGYVTITFASIDDAPGVNSGKTLAQGVPQPVRIPVSIAVDSVKRTLDYCYNSASYQNVCEQIGGTYDTTTNFCIKTMVQRFANTTCQYAPGDCPSITYPRYPTKAVQSFGPDGKPNCGCVPIRPH